MFVESWIVTAIAEVEKTGNNFYLGTML